MHGASAGATVTTQRMRGNELGDGESRAGGHHHSSSSWSLRQRQKHVGSRHVFFALLLFVCCCLGLVPPLHAAADVCNTTEQALRLVDLRQLVTDPFGSLASWALSFPPVAVAEETEQEEEAAGDAFARSSTDVGARLCGEGSTGDDTRTPFAGITCDIGGCVIALDLTTAGIGGDVERVLRGVATAVGPTLQSLYLGQNALTVGALSWEARRQACVWHSSTFATQHALF